MAGIEKKNKKSGAGQSNKKKRPWIVRNFLSILLSLILIAGLGLLLYPTFANWWNSTRQSRLLEQYVSEINEVDQKDVLAAIESAKEYNSDIAKSTEGIAWKLSDDRKISYNRELNISGGGIMGYIEINSLDIMLPIYHGTDDTTLQIGIGHLESTSLPVGAKTYDDDKGILTDPNDASHCVISGHRGLPSSRLFTDLDKMQEGDTFALNIYNNLMIYEVDQIRVVLPEDLSELDLEKGKDYCTLVTCTPYGINSHRLLVRGVRVSSQDAERFIYRIQGNATQIKPAIVAVILATPAIIILFIIAMIRPGRERRKQQFIDENLLEELEVAELPIEKLDIDLGDIIKSLKKKE